MSSPSNTWAAIAVSKPTPAKPRLPVVIAAPTDPKKDNYKHFIFFVRSGATEFLNNVKQGSADILDGAWWEVTHKSVMELTKSGPWNNYGILDWLCAQIYKKLDASVLGEKQKEEFREYMMQAYARYNAVIKETCYCDDLMCMGDCGVHACGCIDVCRCHCYRGGRGRYDDWY
jgi:hypothetical protein